MYIYHFLHKPSFLFRRSLECKLGFDVNNLFFFLVIYFIADHRMYNRFFVIALGACVRVCLPFMLGSLGQRSSWWSNTTMRYLRFIFLLRQFHFLVQLNLKKRTTKSMQITRSQKHFFTINLDSQNQVIALFFILS